MIITRNLAMLTSFCITLLLSVGLSSVSARVTPLRCSDADYYYPQDDTSGHKKGDRKYTPPFQGPCVDTCTAAGKCHVELEKPVAGLL
jgi:hypothetical protein